MPNLKYVIYYVSAVCWLVVFLVYIVLAVVIVYILPWKLVDKLEVWTKKHVLKSST